MIKKIVSFDFDGTLACPEIQQICREIKQAGITVAITTSRRNSARIGDPHYNDDLLAIADLLGISTINFTNLKDKVEFFIDHPEYVIHIDDDLVEVGLMERIDECKTQPVLWQELSLKDLKDKILKAVQ